MLPNRLKTTKHICFVILSALDAAHKKGIYHGNLKPSNIRLTLHYYPKVLDWFLVKPEDTIHAKRYFGPERFFLESDAENNGILIDCWAIGLIFYYLYTGKDPMPDSQLKKFEK